MPRLILYNIAYGQGLRGVPIDYLKFWKRFVGQTSVLDKVGSSLSENKPDIVGLVECDLGGLVGKNQLTYLQGKLQHSFSDAHIKYCRKGVTRLLHWMPVLRKQANGINTHYKIISKKYHSLSCGMKRIVLEYALEIEGKQCTCVIVHLALGEKTRAVQIRELAALCKAVNGPLIVMGDFNAHPDELQTLLVENGLCDALRHKAPADFHAHTFPSHKPSKRLDYILTSAHITINGANTISVTHSDHLPAVLDFSIVN